MMRQEVTTGAEFRSIDGGHFAVTGELGFDTVRPLLAAASSQLAAAAAQFEVDLSGVTQSDSAGLALLIEWLKLAQQSGKSIRFTRVPDQLRALARISEIEAFLPIAG